MKILKWLGIVLAVIVVVLVVVAWMIPETRYETTVTVNRPIDEVWDAIADEDRTTEWIHNLTEFERTSGEPLTVGATYRLVFDIDGNPFEMTEEMVVVEPKTKFGFTLDNPLMTSNVIVRLEDMDGKTRITTENGVRGKHVFRFLMPGMKQQMIDEQATTYDTFKAMVEGEAPPEMPKDEPMEDAAGG